MKERKFTPPFLIQMSCSDVNKHCDKFPFGSIHEVKQDEEGRLWRTTGVDPVPNAFSTRIIDVKPETKLCPSCIREFPKDWPFAEWREDDKTEKECCVRCYERQNIGHKAGFSRDDYRQKVKEEIKLEMGLK